METTIPDYPRGVTFEQVWAAIQASRVEFEREKKEWDERFEREKQERIEQFEQFEREKKEREERLEREGKEREARYERDRIKNDEQAKKWAEVRDKAIGRISNRIGEFIEEMVTPNLLKKFQALGFSFSLLNRKRELWYKGRILTEIDVVLENDEIVLAVEVKSKPSADDVREHIERMGKVRAFYDNKGDTRKFMGAVAGMVFDDKIRNYTLKCGFYVIQPSGDTFDVIAPEGKYKPREW